MVPSFIRITLACFVASLVANRAQTLDFAASISIPGTVITKVQVIKKLSETELSKKPLVKIDGVVTYYDPRMFLCFVQDETGGIFVRSGTEDHEFRAGDLVRVDGIASKGRLSNVIDEPVFTRLGRAPLPVAKALTAAGITDPGTDADRVQIKGVLRSVSEEMGRLVYYIGVGSERIPVTVLTLARGEGTENIGRTISVTGVHAALYDENRKRYGMRLLCNSLREIALVRGENTVAYTDLPVISVSALADQTNGSLCRVQLISEDYTPTQFVSGRDATGLLLARTSQQAPVSKGTVLDIVGYVVRTNGVVVLDDAYFRRIGFGNRSTFAPRTKPSELRMLESVAEVRRLPLEEAKREYPVRIRGVITYYDSSWTMCFVQGATEGIYVHTHSQPLDIASGQLVIVSGYTGPGDFAPIIMNPKFDVIGKAPMPRDKSIPFAELLSGSADSQWIEINCVVRAIKDMGPTFQLEIIPSDSGGAICYVTIPKSSGRFSPPDLVGSRVEIEAVCATEFDDSRRLKGVHFLCPGFRHIRVVESSLTDPFSIPITQISGAFQFQPNLVNNRRLHVEGSVTWTDGGGNFFLQDVTGGLKVHSKAARVAVGQQLHVVGFRSVKESTPALEHALVRAVGDAPEVGAREIAALDAFDKASQLEGRLLRMNGKLLESRRTADGIELALQDDNSLFTALLLGTIPGWLAQVEPGSALQITGVAVFARDASFRARSMQLLARSVDDLQIVKRPAIWTLRRMGIALAVLLASVLLGGLWIAFLRNRVAHHRVMLEANMEKQRALETQVVQSQKMESIGSLAGGVAHDFNNLLMIILGYIPLLKGEKLTTGGREALAEISDAGNRAADLTRQLLLFSRKQTPKMVVLELNETVRGLMRMLTRLLGEDVSLKFNGWLEELKVNADKGMLEQVLMNLAVNSRDAMPNGGSLVIRTEVRHLEALEMSGLASPVNGNYVCLSVSDTGEGIPEEHLGSIFDPFFTTKEVGKGTGLGLATVYGIVKQHGGAIDVQSKVGVGTTFRICLPLAEGVVSTQTHSQASIDGAARSAKILLVEDDQSVRRLARQTLEKAGHEVVEAGSGPAALALTGRLNHIDLLISDVIMPESMTGADLAREIKIIFPNASVILTSGYSEFRGRSLDMPPGAAFLQKPYTPDVFLNAVNAALDLNRPVAKQQPSEWLTHEY